MEELDVDALMHRVRAGDAAAFEALYDRYARVVFGVALRMLGDADAAEDVVQVVFFKVWSSPTQFRGGNFAAWIARVARNQGLDYLRRRTRRRDDGVPVDAPTEDQPETAVFAALDGRRVRAALAGIPREQRVPIELGFFDGITHEEIARRVDAPLGTVKTRIRAGLRRLRLALADETAP